MISKKNSDPKIQETLLTILEINFASNFSKGFFNKEENIMKSLQSTQLLNQRQILSDQVKINKENASDKSNKSYQKLFFFDKSNEEFVSSLKKTFIPEKLRLLGQTINNENFL